MAAAEWREYQPTDLGDEVEQHEPLEPDANRAGVSLGIAAVSNLMGEWEMFCVN